MQNIIKPEIPIFLLIVNKSTVLFSWDVDVDILLKK